MLLEPAPITIEDLLHEVVFMVAETAKKKNIQLSSHSAPTPVLLGDKTRLKQALLNFVSNAIKFTDHGAVSITVIKEVETDADVLLRFSVQDAGIGIAADAMPRLFTPFEQADNTMNRKYGGTGLGLAITKQLAKLMGGQAGAVSEQGLGSTFWFTAKLAKQNGATYLTQPQP